MPRRHGEYIGIQDDSVAPEYHARNLESNAKQWASGEIRERIESKQAAILHIGAGKGNLVKSLRQMGYQNAVELDYQAVEGADEAVKVGEAEAIPFADESFDIVTSTGLLDGEFYGNNVRGILNEIARILRKGGLYTTGDLAAYLPQVGRGLVDTNIFEIKDEGFNGAPRTIMKK